jgi:uncharacterized protein (DUF1800 family)
MKPNQGSRPLLWLSLSLFFAGTISFRAHGAEANPTPPRIIVDKTTNGEPRLAFPYPAAQQYNVFSASSVTNPLLPDTTSGKFLGPTWIVTNGGPMRFYKITATTMSSNDVFTATVLNRLTYGPTPDDIDHIHAVGPQQFINEQMAGELIADSLNIDPPITNTPPATPPPNPLTNWIRVTATGTSAAGASFAGFYLNGAGSVYLDNIWLCYGTNAETGTNLIVNGDFETTPLNPPWTNGSSIARAIVTNSPTVDGLAASGSNCLLLVASGAAGALNTGFHQQFATNNSSATNKFTLSFYYLPVQNTNALTLTGRLTGGSGVSGVATGLVVLPTLSTPPPTPPTPPPNISGAYSKLTNVNATINDLRAWHVFRAIHSPRQLQEILAQFFQNHFTTQYQKTQDYFDNNFQYGAYTNDNIRTAIAVDLHWREHNKFRQALLDPNCTFYDLLKISIESEAMIIYLDTILNSKAAPNQNYGREVMELHTMGADNGYIQQDIVDLAKVWTGWRVDKKDASVANNPFATPISHSDLTNLANTPGLWVLHFNTNQHDTTTKRIFTNGPIAARFGAQFGAGQSYSLILSNTQATGTNGFGEGYKFAQHVSTLPYTMEFVSVKLCRLFVHENFQFGVYDYTTNNPTPEVQLVKDCMTAWNTAAGDGRKGNIRLVLNVIFNSDLFRGQGASQQKVKTPLEYAVSAVRALRIVNTDTNTYFGSPLNYVTSTCDSDGYGISGNGNTPPLITMGNMQLFNKTEPDGYSEFGRIWLNTANLCERMRFVQHLLMPTSSSTKDDDYGSSGLKNTSDPVALIKARMPSANWNNDAAVVNFFLGLLFPGEGAANMGRDRQAAIDHLNSNDLGNGSSSFSGLSGAAYDGRVRSMVGFLMSLPRFQEQ